MDENIINIIEKAPFTSGCYIFKNQKNTVLYIGKSKSLRNRLRSYCKVLDNYKLNKLVEEAKNLEIILTENETEALILECDLIKKHKPRYNSDLKKNRKDYFLRIGRKEDFPSITVENNICADGGKYYGVYSKPEHVEESILLLNEIWKIPVCNKRDLTKIDRPCIQYDMKKCVGPCGKISSEDYKKITKEIISFFNSSDQLLLKRIDKQLQTHIKNLEFEKAGEVNQTLINITKLRRRVKRLDKGSDYKNVVLFFRGYNENGVTVFYIEKDKILLKTRFDGIIFNEEKALEFISKVKNKEFIANNYILKNLQEIKCDKMFAKINFTKDISNILIDLEKQWIEYFNK